MSTSSARINVTLSAEEKRLLEQQATQAGRKTANLAAYYIRLGLSKHNNALSAQKQAWPTAGAAHNSLLWEWNYGCVGRTRWVASGLCPSSADLWQGQNRRINDYSSVYMELYRQFSITSYKLLPASKFSEAINFLNDWFKRLWFRLKKISSPLHLANVRWAYHVP